MTLNCSVGYLPCKPRLSFRIRTTNGTATHPLPSVTSIRTPLLPLSRLPPSELGTKLETRMLLR